MLQFGGINFVEEQWDIIWGSPCDFEECSNRNRMKSNITKCIRVYLGTNNCHKLQQQKWDETSHCESKDSKLFLLWRLSADKNWGEGSLIYIYFRWLGMPTRCIIQKRRERDTILCLSGQAAAFSWYTTTVSPGTSVYGSDNLHFEKWS